MEKGLEKLQYFELTKVPSCCQKFYAFLKVFTRWEASQFMLPHPKLHDLLNMGANYVKHVNSCHLVMVYGIPGNHTGQVIPDK